MQHEACLDLCLAYSNGKIFQIHSIIYMREKIANHSLGFPCRWRRQLVTFFRLMVGTVRLLVKCVHQSSETYHEESAPLTGAEGLGCYKYGLFSPKLSVRRMTNEQLVERSVFSLCMVQI